jgi:hypothetical protein
MNDTRTIAEYIVFNCNSSSQLAHDVQKMIEDEQRWIPYGNPFSYTNNLKQTQYFCQAMIRYE